MSKQLKLEKEPPVDAEPTFAERLHRLEASYELYKQQVNDRIYILEQAVTSLLQGKKLS
jgi:N-formylglutamate amidohydrolase